MGRLSARVNRELFEPEVWYLYPCTPTLNCGIGGCCREENKSQRSRVGLKVKELGSEDGEFAMMSSKAYCRLLWKS